MTLTPIAVGSAVAAVGVLLTSENIGALTIAATALASAIFIGIVNVIVAWKTKGVVEEVKAEAKVIVGHVNSEKTSGLGREALLEAKVELLERMLGERKEAAALLAQAAATAPAPLPAPAATLGTPDKPVEMKIVNPESDPANVNQISKP